MILRIGFATLMASGLVLTGCGSDRDGDKTSDGPVMEGRLIAPECGGGWDLEHSQVTLRNQSDEIIGTATTSASLIEEVDSPCVVDFEIDDVPNATFYTIKIGTHEGPAWSAEEMEAMEFDPELSLGDAALPDGDADTFCEDVDALELVLDDIDMLNDRTLAWNRRVWEIADSMLAFGVRLSLDEDPNAGRVIELAQSLTTVNGWTAAKPLTASLDHANRHIPGLSGEYGCGYWDRQAYVAG